MDWQQIISLGIVALSALLLARSEIQKRKCAKRTGCRHGCGCEGSALGGDEIFTLAEMKTKAGVKEDKENLIMKHLVTMSELDNEKGKR